MFQALGLALLLAAGQSDATPAPAASPLKEIIRVRSTPFCTVFRENVFHAVQGLRVNDAVLVEGGRFLNAVARDSVTDPGSGQETMLKPKTGAQFGNRTQLDQYRSGQAAHAVAENLVKVHQLLSDPDRFPTNPQTDAERDLALMKERLEAVAASNRSISWREPTRAARSTISSIATAGSESSSAPGSPTRKILAPSTSAIQYCTREGRAHYRPHRPSQSTPRCSMRLRSEK